MCKVICLLLVYWSLFWHKQWSEHVFRLSEADPPDISVSTVCAAIILKMSMFPEVMEAQQEPQHVQIQQNWCQSTVLCLCCFCLEDINESFKVKKPTCNST